MGRALVILAGCTEIQMEEEGVGTMAVEDKERYKAGERESETRPGGVGSTIPSAALVPRVPFFVPLFAGELRAFFPLL